MIGVTGYDLSTLAAAKTLHPMSPCTPVNVPAQIAWIVYSKAVARGSVGGGVFLGWKSLFA